MMFWIRYVVWLSVLGMTVSVSSRAFRNLNKKVNLLKGSFQRELDSQKRTFQREIDNLNFEVLDLKTELNIERGKTARLEEQLNGTAFDGAADDTDTTSKHQRKKTTKPSKKADRRIHQQLAQEIENLVKSVESHGVDIAENKKMVSIAKEIKQKLSVCSTLGKAFQEVKKHTNHLLEERKQDEVAILSLSADIRNQTLILASFASRIEVNTEGIATLHKDIDQGQTKGETFSYDYDVIDMYGDYRPGGMGTTLIKTDTSTAETTRSITSLQTSTETVTPTLDTLQTSIEDVTPTLDTVQQKCLEDIRAGGEAMAKQLYVGVTVKRGKDWKWGDQDSGGHGTLYNLPENREKYWIRVEWDNGLTYGYRMGVEDAYDIAIVEEKYDFSRCN